MAVAAGWLLLGGNGVGRGADAPLETQRGFQIASQKILYDNSFGSSPKNGGWTHWFPSDSRFSADYDASVGDRAPGSIRLTSVESGKQGLWRRVLPIAEGGLYRLSGSFKTDDPDANRIGLAVRPVDENGRLAAFPMTFMTENTERVNPGQWKRIEMIWIAPMSGALGGQRYSGYDLWFFARQLRGTAWCDDFKAEKVGLAVPFHSGFEHSLDGWEYTVRPGNESEGEIDRDDAGFADPGSLQVRLKRGVPGVAASRTVPRSVLDGAERWTLAAMAKASGNAMPNLAAEQLDAAGKTVADETGTASHEADWRSLALPFELRKETASVRLSLLNGGSDAAVFDNVLLRPAYGSEKPEEKNPYPVRVGVYPADPIAAIDDSRPKITALSRQATAVAIFLWGEKRSDATTTLDMEVPSWLKVLTAQQAVHGKAPVQWETMPGKDANSVVLRFTNPYPWAQAMAGNRPNHYTNFLVVFEAGADPGTEGEIVIRSQLDGDAGEERRLPIVVRDAIQPVARPDDFKVGMWSSLWLNVIDDEAREKLLSAYAAAGFNIGDYCSSQAYAVPTFQKLGLGPVLCGIASPCMNTPYQGTPLLTDDNAMRMNNGRPYKEHVAIGLALNDPRFQEAYKKYIAKTLEGFPSWGRYAFFDLEYWGNGGIKTACFHPATVEAFRAWAKLPADEHLTPELILSKYGEPWKNFRVWSYVEMNRIAKERLREINPDIELIPYDYPLDKGGSESSLPMSALGSDPVVDGHLTSTYNREGIRFIETLENTIPYFKKPVWTIPFLMKEIGLLHDPNYHYAQISAREYRFQVVATAAYGAKGISGYPGQLLDADYLHALRDGVRAVGDGGDFYFKGKRDDALVELVHAGPAIKAVVHRLGNRVLLTIFNVARESAKVAWRFDGKEASGEVEAQGFAQIELPGLKEPLQSASR